MGNHCLLLCANWLGGIPDDGRLTLANELEINRAPKVRAARLTLRMSCGAQRRQLDAVVRPGFHLHAEVVAENHYPRFGPRLTSRNGYLPGGRYAARSARPIASSTSSTESSTVVLNAFAAPPPATVKATVAALTLSGNSAIRTTSSSPNA